MTWAVVGTPTDCLFGELRGDWAIVNCGLNGVIGSVGARV